MKDRAKTLLGQGHSQSTVASALGVSESYISQFLSDENFSAEVIGLRAAALSAATDIDEKYNKIENTLLDKLEIASKLFISPRDILNALTKINAAKRRGVMAAPALTQDRVVVLELPQKVDYKFITNINQQVVEIQEPERSHSLITIPIKDLGKIAHENSPAKAIGSGYETSPDSKESGARALPAQPAENLADYL